MSRAVPKFTEEKRAEIRTALLDVGAELFTEHGLEETTIADLTSEAGIAAGTFYSFFDSKGELFAAVLRREAEYVYADLRVILKEHAEEPAVALRQFIRASSESLLTNPLFRRTMDRADRDKLLEELSDTEVLNTQAEKRELLVPYIERWQEGGHMAEGDPETIASGILFIASLPLHREALDEERYSAIMDVLIEWTVQGLCR